MHTISMKQLNWLIAASLPMVICSHKLIDLPPHVLSVAKSYVGSQKVHAALSTEHFKQCSEHAAT